MTESPGEGAAPGCGVPGLLEAGRPGGGGWIGPTDAGLKALANPLWRTYCDRLHASLIREWVGAGRFHTTLKTDLFEEALGDGLAGCLAASTNRLLGIDLSPAVVDRARARHPGLSAEVADVRHLPQASGSIDLVVCTSTLDHFEERSDVSLAVRELVRVLAPGGQLFITFDNPTNPMVALRNRLPASWFGRTTLLPYFVGHTLSLRALQDELSGLGLEPIRSGHTLHAPRIGFLHLCRLLDPSTRLARWLLRFMLAWEALSRWPTASISGHFVAVLARKRD